MAIKGLTDRQSVVQRFSRLGKIKKGEMVNGSPVDLDHFRFVGEGSRAEAIEAAFAGAYGAEPREVTVYLPYKSVEENWQTWMEEWGASGLLHRCDGEYMVQWLQADKTYKRDYDLERKMPCPYQSGQRERTTQRPGCVQVGRLAVIVPELVMAGFVGYVTVELHSINDLANLTSSLLDAEAKSGAALNPNGLQGIEFKLRRQLEEIGVRYTKKNGDIVKTRGQKWMVRIDPSQTWVLHQLETSRQLALGHSVKRPALTVESAEVLSIVDDDADLMPTSPEESPFAVEVQGAEVAEVAEQQSEDELIAKAQQELGAQVKGNGAAPAMPEELRSASWYQFTEWMVKQGHHENKQHVLGDLRQALGLDYKPWSHWNDETRQACYNALMQGSN
jgi:hypothetical protein